MKIFTATLGTETNTFSNLPTGLKAFQETCLFRGGDYKGKSPIHAVPLKVWRTKALERGWMVTESLCAFAQPAGITVKITYESLRDEILADLRAALPVDAVLLSLHGAMVADGYHDCEGDLLHKIRSIVGPNVVIGAELDLHGHLTDKMMSSATVLVFFKEYPHIDAAERADDLFELVADAAQGKTRPVLSVHDCGMVGIFHTTREPMRGFVDRLSGLEGRDGILSISFVHSFPWGDVPDMGAKVLVIADGDHEKASRVARSLGEEVYGFRQEAQPLYLDIDAALERVLRTHGDKPIVIADVSDNAGGGAASDSTFLLDAMLRRGMRKATLGMLWDPVAVQLALDVDVGGRLDIRLGGKMGPASGAPLDVSARVVGVARAAFGEYGITTKASQPLGDMVALDIEGITVVANTIRGQCRSIGCFTNVGVKVEEMDLVVVKSMQHFHATFAPLAREVLYVAGPGALTPDFRRLPYRYAPRQHWPLLG